MTTTEIRSELVRGSLQAYRDEYNDLSETWRHLDSKAQGTIAVSGIFLGAAFAFVRQAGDGHVAFGVRFSLCASIVLLASSVILAMLALRVREVASPPLGQEHETLVTDLVAIQDDSEIAGRLPGFLGDQIRGWRRTNGSVTTANADKAGLVLWAQFALVVAVVIVALISFILIV